MRKMRHPVVVEERDRLFTKVLGSSVGKDAFSSESS